MAGKILDIFTSCFSPKQDVLESQLIGYGDNPDSACDEGFQVIDGVHELYTITAGMMLGLRYAIGHSIDVLPIQNSDPNFHDVEKIEFPPGGNTQPPFKTPPHNLAGTFAFKTYAPLLFRRLRDFFGVDCVSYTLSVCGNYNYLEFISNSKSGQFFFFSHDGKYMIKTQTFDEFNFMKRILPQYYKYVTENPHTFLVRIYGMHRVKMHDSNRKTHFVVYQSVFDTSEPIHKMYDLKGSLIGRSASREDRENGGVLKDQDLIDDKVKLKLGSKRNQIIEQLDKDAHFLAQLNIMDYSVLLGIHDKTRVSSGEVADPSVKSVSLRQALRGRSITVDKNNVTDNYFDFQDEEYNNLLWFLNEKPKSNNEEDGNELNDVDLDDNEKTATSATPPTAHQHPWTSRDDGGIESCSKSGKPGNEVYYIGVIDILQQYNTSKRFETMFKGLKHDKKQISSVDSKFYADRFAQFMKDNTM